MKFFVTQYVYIQILQHVYESILTFRFLYIGERMNIYKVTVVKLYNLVIFIFAFYFTLNLVLFNLSSSVTLQNSNFVLAVNVFPDK
jgi:hypothetical protein